MHIRRLLLFTGFIIFLSVQQVISEPLCRLDFEGNQQLQTSLLRAELNRFGDSLKTLAPAFFAEHLHDFYKNYGFLEAKIEASRSKNSLKFTITEGPALVIDQVDIVSCDPTCMRDEVQKRAREVLSDCSTKTPFEFTCIEKGCRQLEAIFARDGFSDVRVKNWHLRPHALFATHDSFKKCVLELDLYLGVQRFVSSVRAESPSGELFKNAFLGSPWERVPVPFDLYMIREQRLWLLRFFGGDGGDGGDGGNGGDGGGVELSPSWTFVNNRADIVWTCVVSARQSVVKAVAKDENFLKEVEEKRGKRCNELFVRGGLQVGGRGYAMQLFPFVSGSFCSRAASTKASLDVLLSESFCSGSAQYQFTVHDDWLNGLSVEGTSWNPCGYGASAWCGKSRLSKSGFYGRTAWNGSVSGRWRACFGGGFELVSPPHLLPRLVFSPSLSYRSERPGEMGASAWAVEGVLAGIVPLSSFQNRRTTPALLKAGLQGEYGRLLGEHLYGEVRGRLGIIGGGVCAEVHPFDRLFMRRGALLSGLQNSFGEQIGSFGFCPYTGSCGGTGLFQGLAQLSTPLSRSMELACFVEGGRLWRSGLEGQCDEKTAVVGIGLHIKTPVGKLCADIGWDLCSPAHPRDAFFWFFGWDARFS
ncbi:MAG: hypothetical protein UV38_C0002G0269 [candidate division TM6 bacterium GW2011_GWE2_42_60]|nr:MAG: hypothetical protein UV38_C0002G0269 [candidate division TM6 bacterium GW2011_GWE2_42_60]HBY05979.1 hypothetical protein [Candidatus Dependentiae bacterium]